ncbi:MAG: bacteriophage abortive infection AbiH family protein [Ruminococcus sp.]|jgi:hypothetical protein|nr:bacteriophage abortive infection AbiH family protein [Ruminococcus sp.]
MANITFILGNGFDLNLGLKTRYTDFYEEYVKTKPTDTETIKEFKEYILKPNLEKWGDFEKAYGEFGQSMTNNGVYKVCFLDFVNKLRRYLKHQQERINWSEIDITKLENILWDSTVNIENNIHFKNKRVFSDIKNNSSEKSYGKINFIQFNYTNVFDKILASYPSLMQEYFNMTLQHEDIGSFLDVDKIGLNLHIHGDVDGYMAVGVDNLGQILNTQFQFDHEITNMMVKPEYLDVVQDELLNEIDSEKAIKAISESSVIILFGKSIGETDKRWWGYIGEWLNKYSNTKLLIIDKIPFDDDKTDHQTQVINHSIKKKREKEILENFKYLSELSDAQYDYCKDRIFIDLNTDLFKFDLGLKDETKTLQPA